MKYALTYNSCTFKTQDNMNIKANIYDILHHSVILNLVQTSEYKIINLAILATREAKSGKKKNIILKYSSLYQFGN